MEMIKKSLHWAWVLAWWIRSLQMKATSEQKMISPK